MKRGDKRSDKVLRFIDRVIKLSEEMGLSIAHEDQHGGFIIEPYDEVNIKWFKDAMESDEK